jgi:ribonucleotide monophosphatase NagD (HAD superfamily)
VSYIRRFGRFSWEFIVGDNLPLALGAGAAIGLTALLVDKGVNAWWLLPIAILGALTAAVLRTTDTK